MWNPGSWRHAIRLPLAKFVLHSLLTSVVLLASAGRRADGGESPRELACAPSSRGYVTTWLVAGPLRFGRVEELDRDFLAGAGGEAKAQPREGDVADAAAGIAWQPVVFPENVVDFRERTLPAGSSAFYLAAELVPRKDLDLTLAMSHTGCARVWLDGRQIITSNPDPFALQAPVVTRRLTLRAGRRARLLLKLGSEGRRLQFLLRLLQGRAPVEASDLAIALPLGQGPAVGVDAYVLSALRLGLGSDELVTPGKRTEVLFGIDGGYPLAAGRVGASVTIKDSLGRKVETLEAPPAPLADLALDPARLAWTPPADGHSAYYEILAQVSYDGRPLGALSKTVYSPRDIGRWGADLDDRAAALRKKGGIDPDDLALALLKIEKATARPLDPYGLTIDQMHRELKAAADTLARLEQGKPLPPLEPGEHELAYLAEQDDSPQPYFLHIPRSYDGLKPIPAIVYLHGYAPWLDKTNWHLLSAGLTDQAELRGVLIICPFARSNTDFQGIGEADVLHVLDLARKRVKIDPDRLFLLGYSMGGMGAYTVAAHTPDLWAGVLVMCGRADYYFWKDLDPARVEPFKRFLLDTEFGWPLAPSFLHLPVIAYQGTADILIKPQQAYRFVDYLKGLGANATLVRHEGLSHWIADETFSTPGPFDWMDRQRRVAEPRTVRYKTYTLLYNRAYWLTIDSFAQWGQPAQVEVTLHPRNRIELTAANVARLTLRPPRGLCNPKLNFPATVNGKAVELKPNARGELHVDLAAAKAGPLQKSPTLCGPIKDAFNRRFLFVAGTGGGPEAARANLALAEGMQKDWQAFAKGLRAITRDTDLPDAEMARSNLILFGTPKTNTVLARIADKLPIRFTDGGYEILGKTYKADEKTGLLFIYPNPLAAERYVVVAAGCPYGGQLGVNHKYDLLPDFIVYSDEADYDDSPGTYCAGFFDTAWQLDPKLLWTSDGRAKPKPAAALAAPEPAFR